MIQASTRTHTLHFRFPAGTSRGVLHEHTAHYIYLQDPEDPQTVGIGEAAPLKGLSPEYGENFGEQVAQACALFSEQPFGMDDIATYIPHDLPSLRFAFEVALRDYENGGKRHIYDNFFVRHEGRLPINGLIWMGKPDFMQEQIEDKLAAGYDCLKLKIGAIDFETELAILKGIRKRFSADTLTLRVDANGAFSPAEALQKLERLAAFDLHSIEQPIAAGQPEAMHRLCQNAPLPIALDEELIGVMNTTDRIALLDHIQPPFIILKPTLVGGLSAAAEWIRLAEARGIGWWITSALESNIGLNAIAQFTAEYTPKIPQGLGTGQLYHNNIPSPLRVEAGTIRYDTNSEWEVI